MSDLTPRLPDLSLIAYSERLASVEPAPGGGSAAAAVASLGASLIAMVAGLSADRPKYAPYTSTHTRALETAERDRRELLEYVELDAQVYRLYTDARRLPRDTPELETSRRRAVQEAARRAASVPAEMISICRRLVDEAEALAGRSNLNAASDLEVGALLLQAAARGAAANVVTNLPSAEDEAFAASLTATVGRHVQAIERTVSRIREQVARAELRRPEEA